MTRESLVYRRSFPAAAGWIEMIGSRRVDTIQEMFEIGISIPVQFGSIRRILRIEAMSDFPSIRYPVVVGVSARRARVNGRKAANVAL
jgi:hypothetical protein